MRNAVFPILDIKNRPSVLGYLHSYKRSQWLSDKELKEFQNKKIRKIIRYAYCYVPYYRRLFKSNNLKPEDIKVAEDLARIPILTREEIKQHTKDLIAVNLSENSLFRVLTSGTTGHPLVLYKDQNETSSARASFYRGLEWSGYNLGDKNAILWGRHKYLSLEEKISHFILRTEFLDACDFGQKKIRESVFKLNIAKPTFIRGYVSSMYSLAKTINQNALNLKFQLNGVSTTSEPLYDFQRNEIEKAFQCEVFDQYGLGEVNSLGFECEEHLGLHIPIERVHIEFLDEMTDEQISNEERGRIIVTSLENYGMPIIRYDTEDLAVKTGESCSCRRNLPLMDSVVGRVVDELRFPNGKVVHGCFFHIAMADFNWFTKYAINQYQVVQTKRDHIILKIDSQKKPDQKGIEELELCIKERCGDIGFDIEFVDEIPPSASGKRKFIISEINET